MPELADICNLTTKKLFGVFSENMGWEQYIALAKAIGEEIEAGADGIVIGHGTDTMGHTAAVLSFMVQDSPVPDRAGRQPAQLATGPSSDAALNLIHAVRAAAYGDIAEVQICMFGPTSDQLRPAAPRHPLPQDAQLLPQHLPHHRRHPAVHGQPRLASSYLTDDYLPRDPSRKVKIDPVYDDRVTILYYYPGMNPDLVDALVEKGYRGIVIAGTGLGHVNKPLYPALERAIEQGVHVVMTVQTLWGYAQMYVYDTGRDLLDIGVVPLDNMLPETALMKLGWVLGHTDDHDEVHADDAHTHQPRDHRARAPQRLPDPPGRPARDRGVHQLPLEVGRPLPPRPLPPLPPRPLPPLLPRPLPPLPPRPPSLMDPHNLGKHLNDL